MKKLILVLAILLVASPVWAVLDVNIVKIDSDTVAIKYTGADTANLPRAFALTIAINGTGQFTAINTFKTGESTASSPGFGIYPARIVIDSTGTVSDYGNPLADPCAVGTTDQILPSNSIVLEFGSLYYADANAPATSGELCRLDFTKGTATQITLVDETTFRGGIVLENGTQTTDTFTYVIPVDECVKSTAPFYADWVLWGKPACWCFQRHCRGDINGLKNLQWVQLLDLNALKAAYQKTDAQLALITNGICADINHTKNLQRVQLLDLNILKTYYQKPDASVPVCDMTNYNFWTN